MCEVMDRWEAESIAKGERIGELNIINLLLNEHAETLTKEGIDLLKRFESEIRQAQQSINPSVKQ